MALSLDLKRKGADYHHGDLRRALVEATIKLVEENGPEAFTLRAAARLAGVSDGAPYHHFADRDALLAAVAEEGFLMLYDSMSTAAQRERGGARDRSLAMGVAYVLFAAKHPARFRLMFGRLVHARARYPRLARAGDRAYQLVRSALADGIAEQSDRAAPPRHAMLNGWALVHGLSMLAIDGHLGDKASNERRLKRLVWEAVESVISREPRRTRESAAPGSGRRMREERSLASRR